MPVSCRIYLLAGVSMMIWDDLGAGIALMGIVKYDDSMYEINADKNNIYKLFEFIFIPFHNVYHEHNTSLHSIYDITIPFNNP